MEKAKEIFTPKRIVALIVLILILVFAFQNINAVELTLILFTIRIPLIFVVLILYVLGIITGWGIKRNDVKKIVENVQNETKEELINLQDQLKNK